MNGNPNDPIYNALQQLGLGGFYGDMGGMTSQDIFSGVGQTFWGGNVPEGLGQASMFNPLTQQQMQQTQSSYYQPLIEGGQSSLLQSLISSMGKGPQTGFSGSYISERAGAPAIDEYGRKVTDLISGTSQTRAQKQKEVIDQIQGWYESGQSMRYG